MNELLSTLPEQKSLEDLKNESSLNTYKKKQIIYSEGNNVFRLFYVRKGKVKTSKTNDDGKELITGLHSDGDLFGHVALLEGTSYKETAEALEETEITSIPRDEFEELMNNNSEVMKKFVQLLAKNVSEKEQQLLSLAYNSLRKKVAEALIKVRRKYSEQNTEKVSIDISRENLANIAGTAKESLIRTLSDFKDEQLINIERGNIIILNEEKLEKMIN